MPDRDAPDPRERPNWPALLNQVLQTKHCFQCKTPLHAGTVVGLGAQLLLNQHVPFAGPASFVILRCPRCQLIQTRVAHDQPSADAA